METIYCCIFLNGTVFNAQTIQEAASISGADYIVKRELIKETIAISNQYVRYKYSPVNFDGSNRNITIGHFQLISISVDEPASSGARRDFLIKNLNNGAQNIYSDRSWGIGFFIDTLIPLMHRLNELGSYEMYHKSFEFESLLRSNQALKDENKRLLEQLQNKNS
jgi:hypothetical protein